MSAVADREIKLRTALSNINRGGEILSRVHGIDRGHVAQTVGRADLGTRVGIAGPELGTAAERMRAARLASEKPTLGSLDHAETAPPEQPEAHPGHDL